MLSFILLLFLLDEFECLFEGDGHGISTLGKRGVLTVVEHVWSETTCSNGDGFAVDLSNLTRQLKQFQGLFEGDGLDALVFRHL